MAFYHNKLACGGRVSERWYMEGVFRRGAIGRGKARHDRWLGGIGVGRVALHVHTQAPSAVAAGIPRPQIAHRGAPSPHSILEILQQIY